MATWEECNQEIEKITPPTGKLEVTENGTYGVSGYYEVEVNVSGGGDCPDLSEDTVTPEKLLSGYTAHDAEGDEIVGTLTGMDLVTCDLSIKNESETIGFSITVLQWSATNERLQNSGVLLTPGTTTTVKIPYGYCMLYVNPTNDIDIKDVSSGVNVVNNGNRVPITSSVSAYMFRVRGSATPCSFTVADKQ